MRPKTPHSNGGHSRRQWRPVVESLETRELMASNALGPTLPGTHYPAPNVAQFVPILYPPGTPQPTAAEVARESFVAKGQGRYTIGPGRFSTQSISIHGYGKPATSNLSRRMHFQFLIFEPTDPTKPVTGSIDFTAGNFLQNGANLILDMAGPTGTEVDGLPTQLNWARDAASGTAFNGTGAALPAYGNFPSNYFTSGGTFANPLADGNAPTSVNNWNMGLGDVNFKYIPDKHPQVGTLGSGTVIFEFRGLLNYSGAQSAFDKRYN
jgi:hypothetical protein